VTETKTYILYFGTNLRWLISRDFTKQGGTSLNRAGLCLSHNKTVLSDCMERAVP